MKSIVYLSYYNYRPCTAISVTHPPEFNGYEQYKHHDPRYTGRYYSLRYVCTIPADLGIHEKINRRAEHIGRTASVQISHGHVCPPDWDDKRRIGRDYVWHHSENRIARSRFRKAKRVRATARHWQGKLPLGSFCNGYACIDIAFGLRPSGGFLNYTDTEQQAIAARLELAATRRAPLPAWQISDCWPEARQKSQVAKAA
jgi:hypothetical protein